MQHEIRGVAKMLDENLPISSGTFLEEEQSNPDTSTGADSPVKPSSRRGSNRNSLKNVASALFDAKPELVAVVFNIHTSPKSLFRGRTFTFRCSSPSECTEWVDAVRKAVANARHASALVSFHQKFQVRARAPPAVA